MFGYPFSSYNGYYDRPTSSYYEALAERQRRQRMQEREELRYKQYLLEQEYLRRQRLIEEEEDRERQEKEWRDMLMKEKLNQQARRNRSPFVIVRGSDGNYYRVRRQDIEEEGSQETLLQQTNDTMNENSRSIPIRKEVVSESSSPLNHVKKTEIPILKRDEIKRNKKKITLVEDASDDEDEISDGSSCCLVPDIKNGESWLEPINFTM